MKKLGDRIFLFISCFMFLLAMLLIVLDNGVYNIVFYIIIGIYFVYITLYLLIFPMVKKGKYNKHKEDE